MTFSWIAAIFQVIMIALIILFFVSLFLFVIRIINNNKEKLSTLKRLEEKMDIIIKEIKEEKN
ncbi:DUF4083 family protein [Gorillibacterium massiliense]|uniref:DUF4083 family protein n=1 Tax=Gorillibacterium massiliense TaxID=1280390 RepID=UPI0004ADCC7D|nr:DUF4083 family protein [Gorillibacterium massiliense]